MAYCKLPVLLFIDCLLVQWTGSNPNNSASKRRLRHFYAFIVQGLSTSVCHRRSSSSARLEVQFAPSLCPPSALYLAPDPAAKGCHPPPYLPFLLAETPRRPASSLPNWPALAQKRHLSGCFPSCTLENYHQCPLSTPPPSIKSLWLLLRLHFLLLDRGK